MVCTAWAACDGRLAPAYAACLVPLFALAPYSVTSVGTKIKKMRDGEITVVRAYESGRARGFNAFLACLLGATGFSLRRLFLLLVASTSPLPLALDECSRRAR